MTDALSPKDLTQAKRLIVQLQGRIAELEAALAKAQEDVRRYRWLRNRLVGFDFYFGGDPLAEKEEDRGIITMNFEIPKGIRGGKDVDAVIDAALSQADKDKP